MSRIFTRYTISNYIIRKYSYRTNHSNHSTDEDNTGLLACTFVCFVTMSPILVLMLDKTAEYDDDSFICEATQKD